MLLSVLKEDLLLHVCAKHSSELKGKLFFYIYLEQLFLKGAHDLRVVCCDLSPFRFTVSDLRAQSLLTKCVSHLNKLWVSY